MASVQTKPSKPSARIDAGTLPDWRVDPRLVAVRTQNASVVSRLTTCDAAVTTCARALADADRALDAVQDRIALGDANASDLAAARALRRDVAERLDEAVQDRERTARLQRSELPKRVEAAEDRVRNELQPQYLAAHRAIVEDMAPLFMQLAALNAELTRVVELVAGSVNLPAVAWPELRVSDKPSHADFQSKLSYWLHEARAAGYDA